MNGVTLVGRITADPEIKELNDGTKRTTITVAVQRNYKNADGEYETDFVDCVLWGGVASNTAEYCKKGDLVGIKGKVETNTYENADGEKKKSTQIVAEKVTFLSTAKEKESDNEKSDDDLDM